MEKRRIVINLLSTVFVVAFLCVDSPEMMAKETDAPPVSANVIPGEKETGRAFLKVPENLDFVIDPLEIGGRGQVYSKIYKIKNVSASAGVLKLSDVKCELKSVSSVMMREEETEEIRRSGEKEIFLRLLFDSGDSLVLTEEGKEYELELQPEQEVTFTFGGMVSENPKSPWEKSDINIVMTYDWKETGENAVLEELPENTVSGNTLPE